MSTDRVGGFACDECGEPATVCEYDGDAPRRGRRNLCEACWAVAVWDGTVTCSCEECRGCLALAALAHHWPYEDGDPSRSDVEAMPLDEAAAALGLEE
jgi:hypothetical protein